jgi:hypothetical protein
MNFKLIENSDAIPILVLSWQNTQAEARTPF